MIRYPITQTELEAKIIAKKANWLSRARKRVNFFYSCKAYVEPPEAFWNEIKEVYGQIQHYKCAYCEGRIGGKNSGKNLQDIDHFRPKRGVQDWVIPDLDTGGDLPDGYYSLAYHPLNLLLSCITCNRERKQSYFPIALFRHRALDNPQEYVYEFPYLIYPLSDIDADPETLIKFDGIVPIPVSTNTLSHEYWRAKVTIDILDLAEREQLQWERSLLILALFKVMEQVNDPDLDRRKRAQREIVVAQNSKSPHCSCARCFCAVYASDQGRANEMAKEALRYIESRY